MLDNVFSFNQVEWIWVADLHEESQCQCFSFFFLLGVYIWDRWFFEHFSWGGSVLSDLSLPRVRSLWGTSQLFVGRSVKLLLDSTLHGPWAFSGVCHPLWGLKFIWFSICPQGVEGNLQSLYFPVWVLAFTWLFVWELLTFLSWIRLKYLDILAV